ncbi:helix-turn-helix domain-containing protein [Methylobacterium aquaticum]|uniref:helix-turn-helix domain-containing protein n=1 Tax=Methylobacterium aquaticum TaxID=270351 RepID=UPI0019320A7A|nr:helix-turn-helix transcriptional regulator [Methylobacterium aquaticum]QRE76495.1 helix-turn-helix transcriptional regulator [Methylobacterium aquaticum]
MTLADYLAEQKLKPTQFARDASLPASTITRILRGEREPSSRTIRRIVQATGGRVTAAELIVASLPEESAA